MEIKIRFSDEQEQDAKEFINAMDENRELLIKYSRIDELIDDLVTTIEHNRGVFQSKEGKYLSVAGVDMPDDVVDPVALTYTLVNAIVHQIENVLED